MLFAVFWVLFINGGIQSITAGTPESYTVPLCCPASGSKLAKISRGLFRSDDYTCLAPPQKGNNNTETLDSSIMAYENSLPVFGYGILRPEEHSRNSSIPQCETKQFIEFTKDEDFVIPPKSCLMSIDDKIIASISCPLVNDESLQPISFIHKCCPNNYIYDNSQQKCVESLVKNYHLYKVFFKNYSLFDDNPISCPRDKVLVEYQLDEYKFSLNNGQMFLRLSNKRYDFSEYCIEAIMNNKKPTADNSSSNSNELQQQPQLYLVRTCDDISAICRRFPCIRRCCNDGEMFTKGNPSPYCKRDESDTAYHSFESLEISGNFTKPSGK